MDFPRGVKHLEGLAIHYTDHNMPYGPFAVSKGHDMLVLHPRAGGIISMANLDARRRINLRGRLFASPAADSAWQPLPGVDSAAFKLLMPPDFGPAAVVVKAPAHAAMIMAMSAARQSNCYDDIKNSESPVAAMLLASSATPSP